MESAWIPWIMFLTGLIFGWLLAWMLQKRLDESLVGQVSELQRELNAANRTIRELSPQSSEETQPAEMIAGGESDAPAMALAAEAVPAAAETAAPAVIAAASVAVEDSATETSTDVEASTDVVASAAVAASVAEEVATPDGGDDLTRVRGIGPKFAETLSAAGVTTYATLAESSPEQLTEIVQPAAWQRVDFEDWIEQAGVLAQQRDRVRIGDDLTRLEGIGPTYAERLRAADIINFAQLAETDEARLAEIIHPQAWQRLNYSDWIAQARLAASGDEAGLKALQDELFSRKGDDNLTLIQGIGKTSADALQGAGIASYAALAAATPDQLSEIMSEAGVRRGNFDAWIEEAKMRAAGRRISRGGRTRSAPAGATAMPCPQDLGEVLGIGEVYEQRLYSVGVGTFWELSMIPQDELSEILEIQDFQDVDLESIQALAKELAESTESMGRIWDGTEPDDFEVLEGIGEVYERRLYAAGICTFSTLAELSVEGLTEICQAPRGLEPNYSRWLEQAVELMAQA